MATMAAIMQEIERLKAEAVTNTQLLEANNALIQRQQTEIQELKSLLQQAHSSDGVCKLCRLLSYFFGLT